MFSGIGEHEHSGFLIVRLPGLKKAIGSGEGRGIVAAKGLSGLAAGLHRQRQAGQENRDAQHGKERQIDVRFLSTGNYRKEISLFLL